MDKLASINKLLEIVKILRGPNGCPWDKKQTFKTLTNQLLEEAHELADALRNERITDIKEELGDLLLMVVFISQIAEEQKLFNIKDVANIISDKLIRRHPHVFGNTKVKGVKEVLTNWEKIKKEEKKERQSVLDGIPKTLPALVRAQRLQEKAARFGFEWPTYHGALEKVYEELDELKTKIENNSSQSNLEEELGDILFSLVNLARYFNISAEDALNKTNDKFYNRFHYIEQKLKEEGKGLENTSLEEMDKLWEESKNVIK